jgi:hypothetical protein
MGEKQSFDDEIDQLPKVIPIGVGDVIDVGNSRQDILVGRTSKGVSGFETYQLVGSDGQAVADGLFSRFGIQIGRNHEKSKIIISKPKLSIKEEKIRSKNILLVDEVPVVEGQDGEVSERDACKIYVGTPDKQHGFILEKPRGPYGYENKLQLTQIIKPPIIK